MTMIKTIVNKLMDKEVADCVINDIEIGFKYKDYLIRITKISLGSNEIDYLASITSKEFTDCESITFENEYDKKRFEYNFQRILNETKTMHINKLFQSIMKIEEDKEQTFDDAQSEIVNNNVEE